MNYLDFCIKNNFKPEQINYSILNKQEIDKLLSGYPSYKRDNITYLKYILNQVKLTNKQYALALAISNHLEGFEFWLNIIQNKNLSYYQFCNLLLSFNNPIQFIMNNKIVLPILDKRKLNFLVNKMIENFVYSDKCSNDKFKNLNNQKLTLEQCQKIINTFEDSSLIVNDIIMNPNILIKVKKIIFEQYIKKEIFK